MRIRQLGLLLSAAVVAALCLLDLTSPKLQTRARAQDATAANTPNGVEVQARGPIHEAFITPTAEPKPTYGVPKKPPAPIEEMPPEEKPEGNAVWIGGYWAWDDDCGHFLCVSRWRRAKHAGKDSVSGSRRHAPRSE